MAEHTSGPWEIDSEDGQWWIYGGKDVRATVGVAKCDLIVNAVFGICKQQNVIGRRMPAAERIANAHLIAAAPDMLTALRGLLDVVNVRIDDPRIKQFDAARAAVAKAEGRTR